jgi:hypothetical protein
LAALFAAGCQMAQTKSPTDTFKAFVDAGRKKDTAAVKQMLSKGSLKMAEDNAKAQNKTVDEVLSSREAPDMKATPETRNEKVEGDTATLEIKNDVTGTWDTMYFAKEDGQWKLALDRAMQEIMKKFEEQMKNANKEMPPADDDDEKADKKK